MVGYYEKRPYNIKEKCVDIKENIYTICCPLVLDDINILPKPLLCLYEVLEIPIINSNKLDTIDYEKYKTLECYLQEFSKYLNLNVEIELAEEEQLGHILRVGYYSKLLAEKLDLDETTVKDIYIAALFHDIGKSSIPKSIIGKKSKLTEDEFNLVKKHCTNAEGILNNFFNQNIIEMIKAHHERYNKSGYPYGIIPDIGARIIGIADSYDAMTTNRVYAKSKTKEEALNELVLCTKTSNNLGKGMLYDPKLVEIFKDIILKL